jgi:hypothetical protein
MSGRLRRQLVDAVPESTLRRLQRLRHGESPSLHDPAGDRRVRGTEPEVVTEFDAHAVRAETTAVVFAALERAGVPFVALPGRRGTVHQIAVDAADREQALAALDPAALGAGWLRHPRGGMAHRAPAIRVFQVLAAPNGRLLAGSELGCAVAFWTRITSATVPRAAGGTYEPGTRVAPGHNDVVDHLAADVWDRAVAAPSHWVEDAPAPGLFEVREPVDIVYAWVDGADPVWQARKAAHEPAAGAHHATATHQSRYIAREELRYSLRSVWMFGGWVRRIHIVTDGQVPSWLDTGHPKINLVDHREIFRDPSVLPVFNSHAIESQLHHIAGLADQYLYFNDDLFFGRPVEPELFFTANGLARIFLSDQTIDLGAPSLRDLPATAAAKNNRTLIERDFGVTVRHKYRHGVHPQLRDVLVELEKRHPDEFARVAASRFRHPDDLSIPSSLHHTYAYLRGRAVPGTMQYRYQDIGRLNTARRLDEILRERPQVFCLNDIATEPEQLPELDRVLRQFFGEYFPLPSPFERDA